MQQLTDTLKTVTECCAPEDVCGATQRLCGLVEMFLEDYSVAWTLVEFLQNGLRDQQAEDREAVKDIITPKLIVP